MAGAVGQAQGASRRASKQDDAVLRDASLPRRQPDHAGPRGRTFGLTPPSEVLQCLATQQPSGVLPAHDNTTARAVESGSLYAPRQVSTWSGRIVADLATLPGK